MKLFNLSKPRDFYLLTFVNDQPVWEQCTSGRTKKVDKPVKKSRLPILAVIPDRYFFFYLPRELRAKNRKTLLRAASLQLRHIFPAGDQEQSPEVLDTGTHILGLFRSAELASFVDRHRDELSLAGCVTTPFLLGLAVTTQTDKPDWIMQNTGDPAILVGRDKLEYFSGDHRELDQRVRIHGPDPRPRAVQFEELTARLSKEPVSWNRFRITLPQLASGQGETGLILKSAMGLFIIGLLFCLGDFFKLRQVVQEKTKWEQELDILYVRALGPGYGPDPYGLLLYRADQAAGSSSPGLDFVDFLGRLSRAAPESLVVESMTLGMDSGTLRASLDSYEKMEKFLENLKQSQVYGFTLDQADSSGGKVNLVMSFRY
jgi:hypothetical protein